MFGECLWLNEPRDWRLEGGVLRVVTNGETDFWRETHYGFTRDTGHFFHCVSPGDFTAEVRVQGEYEKLYDQAGIMVRIDERAWVKAGIEHSDGQPLLSSVLTIGQSDWATGMYGGDAADFRLRVTVRSGVLRLQVSADAQTWHLVRLSPFPNAPSYLVGPMCCSPQRAGLRVAFSDLRVGAPIDKDLHDLS